MCRPQCRSTKQNALEPNSQWAMYGKVCNCVGMGWGGAGAGVGGGAPTLLLLSAIPSLTPIRADNSHLLALTTHDT